MSKVAKRLIDESRAKENQERNYEEESGVGMGRHGHGRSRGMHHGKIVERKSYINEG